MRVPFCHMKRILYLIQADVFVPFFWQLSSYLKVNGYEPCFVTLLPREHLWLHKNGIRPEPENVYNVRNYPLREALFEPGQVDEILRFTMEKTGGDRQVWEERLNRVASVLADLLDTCHFSAVLIWNGDDFIGKILSVLARKRGVLTVYSENGYFPNTLQFDLQGVNVNSSIASLSFPEMLRALEQPRRIERSGAKHHSGMGNLKPLSWVDYLRCFLIRKTGARYYDNFPEHRGSSWIKAQILKIRRSLIPSDKASLPEKYIFIPFQVHDDTQILLNSKFFKSMEEFFRFCHASIKRNFGDEYAIVVKEHPEDLGRYSYSSLRNDFPDVLWLRKYSIDDLLENSDFVFVINSSVGLQALQKGKPTIVLGESFYTKEELVFRVDDPCRIDQVIAQARIGMTPDRKERIEKFIRFLNERYFVSGGWRRISAAGVSGAGDRILELIE